MRNIFSQFFLAFLLTSCVSTNPSAFSGEEIGTSAVDATAPNGEEKSENQLLVANPLQAHQQEIELQPSTLHHWPLNKADVISLHIDTPPNWVVLPSVGVCTLNELEKSKRDKQLKCKLVRDIDKPNARLAISFSSEAISLIPLPIRKASPWDIQQVNHDNQDHYLVVSNPSPIATTELIVSLFELTDISQSIYAGYQRAILSVEKDMKYFFKEEPENSLWNLSELNMDIEDCPDGAYFDGASKRIRLCSDYLKNLPFSEYGSSAVEFVLMHEVGHALLNQWNFPSFANEEQADELGAILLLLFDSSDDSRNLVEAINYWRQQSKIRPAMDFSRHADTHFPDIQRARKLEKIFRGRDAVWSMWEPIIVERMNYSALRDIASGDASDFVKKSHLFVRLQTAAIAEIRRLKKEQCDGNFVNSTENFQNGTIYYDSIEEVLSDWNDCRADIP